jgi:predicted phosphoribosyltransferase
VDRVVCLETPAGFRAVGQAFRDFSATQDEEVLAALESARARGR